MRTWFDMLRPQPERPPAMADLAEAALEEMQLARVQFDEAQDRDLVDLSIYRLQAAERHYLWVLRQAGRCATRSSAEVDEVESTQG